MKTAQAEEIMDKFLNVGTNIISSKEELAAIALMRKLPSGINEQKLLETVIKIGAIALFRYCNSFSIAYIHVLQEAMKSFQRDPYVSKMMLQCLSYVLYPDFTQPETYKNFSDAGKFLQYIDKLQFPVEKAEQFAKSDQYITPAVAEAVGHALLTERYTSRNIRAFNSFVYTLGKSDLPVISEVIKFQIGTRQAGIGNTFLYELNAMINALKPSKELPNTAKAYQLVHGILYDFQSKSLAFQFAKSLGLEPEVDLKWSIKVQVSSNPTEKTPRNGWFVTTEISNMWNDCISLLVKGPKGTEKGNERHGVLLGKGLDFRKIDIFKLRSEMDEIGHIYGIEKLYWENADVSATGFDKNDVKQIRKWLQKN